MEKQTNSTKNSKEDKNKVILGISVISSIVSRVKTSEPTEILAALKQILYFYELIPEEWKKKAYYIFSKLWDRKKVIISTDPDKVENIYEVNFEDDRIQKLYQHLPQMDQAILLQGKSMLDLISKGLHGDSDEVKIKVENRYGQRGLNIVNMLTTKDIGYALDELDEILDPKKVETNFNRWSLDYDSISLLVPPVDLEHLELIEKRILATAKSTPKKFMIINLSGKIEDCTKMLQFVHTLKEKKILNYKSIDNDILDSGFRKSL